MLSCSGGHSMKYYQPHIMRIVAASLLAIYLACSFPLLIIESGHLLSHVDDYLTGEVHIHHHHDHDDSHDHRWIDAIDIDKSQSGEISEDVNIGAPSLYQLPLRPLAIEITPPAQETTENFVYQLYIHPIFLEYNTPPPEYMV